MTLKDLERSAKASTDGRGHVMTRFHRDAYWRRVWISTCKTCRRVVYIEETPMANSTNIFGPAVSENCDGKNIKALKRRSAALSKPRRLTAQSS